MRQNRVITKAWVTIRDDGMHVVSATEPPGEVQGIPWDFTGPGPLKLPDRPLTKLEFDKWTWELCTQRKAPLLFTN